VLEGGFFHDMVVQGIDSVGGPKGAFPSLHVGASVYLCMFDLTTNRLRGLTYLPIVLLIYLATVFLRYHYVVDLVAGTVIGTTCVPLGRWLFSSWVQDRIRALMPALPGGESDNLSIFSSGDSSDA
jgi:membrane-associated phospholipid phosphatase